MILSINTYNICPNTENIHDFKIFLNFLIVDCIPSNIDSPIKKWPMLNSCIPFILDNILAELYVKPCPA